MATATAAYRSGEAEVRDFIALLKPRVMSLVTFTGAVGVFVAPGDLHPFLAVVAVVCIALGAGASGAINMWYERDIDALMTRTQKRPLPQGRIEPSDALVFGLTLSLLSVGLMALAVNYLAAFLLAFASFFYVVIYTMWLKPRTPQNIVIGGAAGAFPPMIGWAAVTGTVTVESFVLFALIFFWTPPHFWALALYKNKDYQRAGIPMLPVVRGERETRVQILLYALLLTPFVLAPYALGMVHVWYAAGALALHGVFIKCAVDVFREEGYKSARGLFAYSIAYLFGLFSLMVVCHAA